MFLSGSYFGCIKIIKAQLAVSNFFDLTTTGSVKHVGVEQAFCAVGKYENLEQCKNLKRGGHGS